MSTRLRTVSTDGGYRIDARFFGPQVTQSKAKHRVGQLSGKEGSKWHAPLKRMHRWSNLGAVHKPPLRRWKQLELEMTKIIQRSSTKERDGHKRTAMRKRPAEWHRERGRRCYEAFQWEPRTWQTTCMVLHCCSNTQTAIADFSMHPWSRPVSTVQTLACGTSLMPGTMRPSVPVIIT